jgi:hypothetical protein
VLSLHLICSTFNVEFYGFKILLVIYYMKIDKMSSKLSEDFAISCHPVFIGYVNVTDIVASSA